MFNILLFLVSAAFAQDYKTELAAQYQLPDPAVATILSSQVGFGAGHFYAKRPAAGLTHLVVQGGGIGLAGYGLVELSLGLGSTLESVSVQEPGVAVDESGVTGSGPGITFAPDSERMAHGAVFLMAGVSTYMVDHLVDTLTAASSAKRTSLGMIEKGRLDRKLERRQRRHS